MAKSEDIQLVTEVLNGQVKSFEKLVQKYQAMVYTLVLKMIGDSYEAEEVAQDVFVKVYGSLGSFQQKSTFSTWLYRITYNESINRLRKNQRKPATDSIDGAVDAGAWDHGLNQEDKEDRKLISESLKQLSEIDQVIVTLYYYEDRPLKEIAEIVSLTESNIKARLHRSRQKLYEVLQKHQEHLTTTIYENRS